MTDDYRLLRILVVPLALLVVFLMISPRMCARAITVARTKAAAPVTATSDGLKIESSAPQATLKPASLPQGLEETRVRYLIEIDPTFSAPAMASMSKRFNAADPVTTALVKMKYAEPQSDGSLVMTSEGALNLKLSDAGDRWTFPVASRAFDRVRTASTVEDGRSDITVVWHWEPTTLGKELNIDPRSLFTATAEFSGGAGQWTLTKWVAPPLELSFSSP